VADKLIERGPSCPNSVPIYEIISLMGADNETEARSMINDTCQDAILLALTKKSGSFVFDRFSGMDHDFNEAFFDGQSSWNDGRLTMKQTHNPRPLFDRGPSE
jgi:hypothetical protein